MANRYFRSQFVYNKHTKPCLINGKVSLSAAAAVTSFDMPGVASVTKNGTGNYDVVLDDVFFELACATTGIVDSTEDLAINLKSFNLPSKTFSFETKVAGVVADVADACEVHISLFFNDSSV
jgi:hypothetical protein